MQNPNRIVTHTPFNKFCQGCMAQARDKPHCKGSFDKKDDKAGIITMDQMTVTEVNQPLGVGGYKYGIIFQRVDTDYWWFVPLRTLSFEESDFHFGNFCKATKSTRKTTLIYYDQQATLKAMAKHFGCDVRRRPLGQPRHNPVVERKVGLALQGISCCLVTGGVPKVFWPMIGRAFVANYTFSHLNMDGMSSYETMFGPITFELFVPGELVFFKPAPTIYRYRPAKIESRPIAGVFLDYYIAPDGKFAGQYIVVGLEGFCGK